MPTHLLLPLFCFLAVAYKLRFSPKDGLIECVSELACNLEEADTKMFWCTKDTEALGGLGCLCFNSGFRYCSLRAVFCFAYIDSYMNQDW